MLFILKIISSAREDCVLEELPQRAREQEQWFVPLLSGKRMGFSCEPSKGSDHTDIYFLVSNLTSTAIMDCITQPPDPRLSHVSILSAHSIVSTQHGSLQGLGTSGQPDLKLWAPTPRSQVLFWNRIMISPWANQVSCLSSVLDVPGWWFPEDRSMILSSDLNNMRMLINWKIFLSSCFFSIFFFFFFFANAKASWGKGITFFFF